MYVCVHNIYTQLDYVRVFIIIFTFDWNYIGLTYLLPLKEFKKVCTYACLLSLFNP